MKKCTSIKRNHLPAIEAVALTGKPNYLKWLTLLVAIVAIGVLPACEKAELEPEIIGETQSEEDNSGRRNASQGWRWGSHRNWTPTLPPKPSANPGNTPLRSWGQWNVWNASDLANATRRATANQIIYIRRTIDVYAEYTISNSNVRVVSKNGVVIRDRRNKSGLSALFNVNGSGVKFENVTIQGPGAYVGKRSAIAFKGNNGQVLRCRISNYSHAAVRLENGTGHFIFNSTIFGQNNSGLGYGVLLRGASSTARIERNMFNQNSHAVATNGNDNQSYTAIGNYVKNSVKWHFDVHKGSSGYYSAKKVVLKKNVVDGSNVLFINRGRIAQGIDVQENIIRLAADGLVKIKADATMSFNGATIVQGNFYNPFHSWNATERTTARNFLKNSIIKNNHINRNISF
ncbi:MAG: hypothetical protein ACFB10_16585 [Salibacteraceae bacterium]